jgi:hypothetical protein
MRKNSVSSGVTSPVSSIKRLSLFEIIRTMLDTCRSDEIQPGGFWIATDKDIIQNSEITNSGSQSPCISTDPGLPKPGAPIDDDHN